MTATATATLNTTTNKVNIVYNLESASSAYVCWSDTETSDYSSLVAGGYYNSVYTPTGTWEETANPPTAGATRYYYFVDEYNYGLIKATSYTSPGTITDFDASLVTGGTLCTFTAPAGILSTSSVAWQRGTDGTTFTTIETTDLSGTTVNV